MSAISIRKVESLKERNEFARLPFKLYKNNPFWVPYIIADEVKSISSEHNPAFAFCKAQFWICCKNNTYVGRIGAIINSVYNEKMNEPIGRFSRFESIDDTEVVDALFHTAENWLKEQGMSKILGPLGFSNLDNQGLLVEGFDHIAAVGSVYHHPYYHEHIERLGYEKDVDWLEFKLKIAEIPEKALRLNEVIKKRYNLEVISFSSKNQVKQYARKIFSLINQSFDELHYVSAFTNELIEFYVQKYFSFLNPRFIKVILNEHKEVVAFIIGLPDISQALRKTRGKLFPFGFYPVFKALRNPKGLELLLTGVDPKLQGQGLSAVLITELQKEILKYNIHWVETTGIFETNHKAIDHWKNYENEQHKRKRCYRKML